MLRNNRVIFLSAGVYKDYSVALSNVHSQTQLLDYVAATDYVYLGSDFPFNHRYMDVVVGNAGVASMVIEVWTGNGWTPVVDIIDETNVAGAPLGQSGIISWQPDLDVSSWGFDDTDEMINAGAFPAGFPKIFKLYWARISFSADLDVLTEINYVGHKFSEDEALEAEYPELSSAAIKAAWKAAKTDWKEQTLMAGEYIVQELRGMKDVITSPSQILDWMQFEKASIHKTAEIIFRGFGDDYNDQRTEAMASYKKAINVGKFNVDLNLDANLEDAEKQMHSRYASR
jgi:hypothetical protein